MSNSEATKIEGACISCSKAKAESEKSFVAAILAQ